MTEELGKIIRPEAEQFKKGRKLFFVPLVFAPGKPEGELGALMDKYWKQVREQIENLESKLKKANKIFHELATDGSDEGIKVLEHMNKGSYGIVKNSIDNKAELKLIEDEEIMAEFMDWSRCLSIGLQSQKVFSHVYQAYQDIQKKRNEDIAKRIDEALDNDETGILLMREGHQVQFPSDIQVFYIAPPSLDEIQRWSQDGMKKEEQKKEKKEDKQGGEAKKEKKEKAKIKETKAKKAKKKE